MIIYLLIALMGICFTICNAQSDYYLGCYYTNWSQHRAPGALFLPKNIDPKLCTHLIYAFANIDSETMGISTYESNDISDLLDEPSLYDEFNKLKWKNSYLKTLLAVGGATAGGEGFQRLSRSSEDRKRFIKSAIVTLRKYGFDGMELAWLYPEGYKADFTRLVQDISTAFENEAIESGRPRLLLTASVAAWKVRAENSYEPEKIAEFLDYINLLAYDFHGAWETITGHNSPLYAQKTHIGDELLLNQNASVNAWIDMGAPAHKLVLGLPLYGRAYTLKSKLINGMNAPAFRPGNPGPYTQADGILAYFEICQLFKSGSSKKWDNVQKVPYIFKGDQWAGFDDAQSLKLKCEYAIDHKLAGVSAWSLDFDDFAGNFCGKGKYPLINSIKSALDSLTKEVV